MSSQNPPYAAYQALMPLTDHPIDGMRSAVAATTRNIYVVIPEARAKFVKMGGIESLIRHIEFIKKVKGAENQVEELLDTILHIEDLITGKWRQKWLHEISFGCPIPFPIRAPRGPESGSTTPNNSDPSSGSLRPFLANFGKLGDRGKQRSWKQPKPPGHTAAPHAAPHATFQTCNKLLTMLVSMLLTMLVTMLLPMLVTMLLSQHATCCSPCCFSCCPPSRLDGKPL